MRIVVAAVLASLACLVPPGRTAAQTIVLPVRFHVVRDLDMVKDGTHMSSWVSASELEGAVLSEINRIWRPADIAFEVAGVVDVRSLRPENRDTLIQAVVGARRDAGGRSDPERIRSMDQLVDTSERRPGAIDVYLVPYLGERSQGNTKRRARRIYVGEWSDKPSGASRPPRRVRLTEPEPMKRGSLARTLAHELGHVLGLRHPEKATQTVFGRLMGGRRAGYALTTDEIATARAHAAALLARGPGAAPRGGPSASLRPRSPGS